MASLAPSNVEVSSPTSRRLRLGIIAEAGELPFAQRELLGALQKLPGTELTLLRIPRPPSAPKPWKAGLLSLWTKVDAWFFLANDSDEDSHGPSQSLPSYAELKWNDQGEYSGIQAETGPVEGRDFDAVICFTVEAGLLGSLAATLPRLWWFESGSEERGWSGSLGGAEAWSVITGGEVSTTRLVEHSAQGKRVIAQCSTATDPISITRQQKRAAQERASLVLHALRVRGDDEQDPAAEAQLARQDDHRNPTLTFRRLAGFVLRAASRGVGRMTRRAIGREQWFIAIRKTLDRDSHLRFENFRVIRPAADRLYADPFVVEKDGHTYIFFEELVFAEQKGKISCLEIDESGVACEPRVVVQGSSHLSYPFVFEWNGAMYMMPEMAASGRSEVYRAVQFPWRWELERVVFENARLYDPTICQIDSKFWLFASGVEQDAYCNSQLHLFFADSPLGPWTPHPQNPVVFDVRRARPAGQLFRWRGELIRPGQDCSSTYGRAIALNRIDVISERSYRETPVSTLGPEWMRGNMGAHTLSWSQQFQAVDCRVWSGKFAARMPNLASGHRFTFGADVLSGRS